jgi:hypothetical protein
MTIISAIMTLNPIAMLVALISHITIGGIWYHPSVFGKAWVELRGMETKPEAKWILVGIVAHVIYTFALAVIVNLARGTTALEGLAIGVMVSVGFIGTMLINELIYAKLPFKLFLIKFGDETISLCVAGIILALWK